MARRVLVGVVGVASLISSVAMASEPGQPIGCSDWVFSEPGITCEEIPIDGAADDLWDRSNNIAVDNAGRVLTISGGGLPAWDFPSWRNTQSFIALSARKLDGTAATVIAQVVDRPGLSGFVDHIRPIRPEARKYLTDVDHWLLGHTLLFDAVNGRLLIPAEAYCGTTATGCPHYPSRGKIFVLGGFTALHEISETYNPSAISLGFRVPALPEGLSGVDHFDTFWGFVSQPFSFANAQPLQCGYPSLPPNPGDFLSVADAVPTPPVGQGVYYITAASYQGQRRFGRRYTNGAYSGRDPGALPVCQ